MALYTVTQPCVVDGRHYTRPSAAPVEVPASEAKALVAAGCLEPVDAIESPVESHPRGRRDAKDSADS